jgi:NAD(P)H-nitrite reductase large subunit
MTKKLVLIGNGMAGMRTIEELLKLKGAHYAITVLGAEPHPNYNRIMLSPVLAGEKTLILGQGRVQGLKFSDGSQIDADLIVNRRGGYSP